MILKFCILGQKINLKFVDFNFNVKQRENNVIDPEFIFSSIIFSHYCPEMSLFNI